MPIVSGAIRRARRVRRAIERLRSEQLRRSSTYRPPARAARPSLEDIVSQPALIVVAHPDDEIIGVGALLSRLPRAGVVTVTDGAPRNLDRLQAAGFRSARAYSLVRQGEAAAALRLLDRPLAPVVNLGVPDQQAVYRVAPVVRRLLRLLRAHPFKYVFTHPYEGGHPDHDATALAVHAACHLIERSGGAAPVIVEMTSYHAGEAGMVYGAFLPHPGAGPVTTLTLDEAAQDLKRRMFERHASQARVLGDFPLDAERFRVAPAYDFLSPPHGGQLAYERLRWELNGLSWSDYAIRALGRLNLLQPKGLHPGHQVEG